MEHPFRKPMKEWLPQIDFGVLQHGFALHGRDYVLILQVGATYEFTLTHVVEMHYETRIADDVWPRSWDDRLTDYAAAYSAPDEIDGYVWGTNWSLGYPGIRAPDNDPVAIQWSERLGKSMFSMSFETDRFKLTIIFHEARTRKLSDDDSTVRQVLNPIGGLASQRRILR